MLHFVKECKLLVAASRAGDREGIENLLKKGAPVNGLWKHYTPLAALIQPAGHVASSVSDGGSRRKCLSVLLRHGAEPNLESGWPAVDALLLAGFGGAKDLVEDLSHVVSAGFIHAAALGDVAVVRKKLKSGVGLKTTGGVTALHAAAGSRLGAGDAGLAARLVEIVLLLLGAGADARTRVEAWGHSLDPVYFAISSGQVEIFALLLEAGGDATTALGVTLWQPGFEFAEVALRHGAKIDEARDEGRPVLNRMAQWGRVRQVEWLLMQGADANVADERGWTALHQTASRGNERMVRALLCAGAVVGRKTRDGKTAIDVANAVGKLKVVNAIQEFL